MSSTSELRLAGQRVAVVGGSSGIGLAVARAAQALGAEVIIASRHPDRALEVLSDAQAVALDVTDERSVTHAFTCLGTLNHLVCTAAAGFPPGLFRGAEEEVRALMESKFWGQYRCARAAAPQIATAGSITLTSGIRSRRPTRGTEAFTPVNAAVEGMARALAVELAPVRVNAVAPGAVETPVFALMPPETRERRLQAAAEQSTVGRVGKPEELAAVYLMCMTNNFVSGTVVDADGGALLA